MPPLNSLIFFILSVMILFCSFQINENHRNIRDQISTDHDRVQEAAQLLIRSGTDAHPIFKLRSIIQAKIIIDELVTRHRGIVTAEKNLGMNNGQLAQVRKQIHNFHDELTYDFMDKIITIYPNFDFAANEAAGLTRPVKAI